MQDNLSNKDLFKKYIEVCNAALAANKNRFPFKQILDAAQKEYNDKKIEVMIVDDHPRPSYIMEMSGHNITSRPHDACQNCNCDGQWSVTRSYLENVLKNPDSYIKNPAKLNWEWLHPEDNMH
jgi:hypothetical protein